MSAVRVFIATTQGPAEVQRITREEPGVQSVVCLNGKALALPVSPAYDAFVRVPTGVIEAAYGHPAYRMDVSSPISEGMSWQLGALVAHGLFAAGRLAEKNEAAARAVWLTGEVDRDLCVAPAEHLSDKIRKSGRLLSELKAAGVPVTLCVPRASLAEVDSAWLESLGIGAGLCEVLRVDSAAEVLESLGLEVPTRAQVPDIARPPRPVPARRAGPWAYGLFGVVVLAVAVAAAARWEHILDPPASTARQAEPRSAPESAPAKISILAVQLRAGDGETCAAVALGAAEPVVTETALAPREIVRTGRGADLCALEYRITNRGQAAEVWVFGVRAGTGARRLNSKVLARARPLPGGESLSLDIPLPQRFEGPLMHRLAVVAAPPSDRAARDRLADFAAALGTPIEPGAWDRLLDDLAQAGPAVIEAAHELSP